MPGASRELLTLPLPPGAPAWFLAYHAQLLQGLQRMQQYIDQGQGLRGQPTISAPLQMLGNRIETVGAAQSATDAVTLVGGNLFSKGRLDTHFDTFYGEDTFPLTATGMTAPVSATAHVAQAGGIVVLGVPELFGTSTTTTCTLTGLPQDLTPTLNMAAVVLGRDQGVDTEVIAVLLANTPTITLYVGAALAPWTASGQKGLFATTLCYLRV
jgi:hypothetical protein